MDKTSPETQLTRRTFLELVTVALGSALAFVLGGAGLSYVISPAFKRQEEDWVDIGAAANVPVGVPSKIEFIQRTRDAWVTTEKRSSAWVATSNGRDFVVFDPRCTHLGCPYRWDTEKKQFLCPCHTAVFDVDGRVVMGPPPRPLDRYPAKVVGGRLQVLPRPERGPATSNPPRDV